MATDVIVQLTGTLFGVPASLNMRVAGGPMSIQLAAAPVSLISIWDEISNELGNIGLSLPDLSGTPWGEILADTLVQPSLWLTPSGQNTSQENVYLELAFTDPAGNPASVSIGGSKAFGPVTITLEPDIQVSGLYIGYGQATGLTLQAKMLTPVDSGPSGPPSPASPAASKAQIVSYPFPLPAQNSVSTFELKYFGLGQRVGPTVVVTGDDPLAAIFQQLETQLVGSDPATIITTLAETFYQPDRNWFVAADLLFRGWELRVLFNDPVFYGLELTAPLQPPSLFAGLLIEILYQKLGANLGVYYGALTLPEVMRRIPLDGFILILPGFSIWIYTNGDFRINVGWPIGSNSIGIQMDILTGEAGFYFARLRSGDNPGLQPSVNYNPILEFGIGFTISASESYSAGIFSASLAVTVGATLQGLIAWNASGQASADILTQPPDHYWFAGSASLAILLQGSVDFAILKASVVISASLYADVAFETGYATVIDASASVSVEVSVHVIFFTVHLSFSTTIHHTFTINPGNPPASVNGPQGAGLDVGENAALLALHEQARHSARRLLASFAAHRPMRTVLATSRAGVVAGSQGEPIDVYFVLQPTAVYDVSPASIEVVATLVAECPPPGSSPLLSPGVATGFARIVVALVTWLVDDFSNAGDAWVDRFQEVATALGPSGEPPGPLFGGYAGFAEQLTAYLASTVTIRVQGVSSGSPPAFETAALLPMFPGLRMTFDGVGGSPTTVDFATFNPTPANYQTAINLYFGALGSLGSPPADGGPADAPLSAGGNPLTGPSVASYLFGDYFVMLARYAINALVEAAEAAQNPQDDAFLRRIEAVHSGARRGGAADLAAAFAVVDEVAAYVQAIASVATFDDLLDQFDYANAAGMASRFMLQGLQLPIPSEVPSDPTPQNMALVPTDGLYALSGQQFAVGAGVTLATATLELDPGSPESIVIAGSPGAMAETSLPSAVPPIPSPRWREIGSPVTGQPGEIDIRPLPPIVAQQLCVALKNSITWSTLASPVTSPGGERLILPLSQPVTVAAQTFDGVQLAISTGPPGGAATAPGGAATAPGGAATAVSAVPALLIRLSISPVQQPTTSGGAGSPSSPTPGSPGGAGGPQSVPFVYQLGGADETTRELIYQALQDPQTLAEASISLLYTPPGSTVSRSDTLVSDVLIAKTNLSTLNQAVQVGFVHGRRAAMVDTQFEIDWAPLGDVGNFLRLIWELSVVQASGFFLYYETVDGQGLPSDLFADVAATASGSPPTGTVASTGGQTAEFNILVQFAATPEPVTAVPAYGNAIWTVDPGTTGPLYALVSDAAGAPVLQYSSGYPAGDVGFEIDWTPIVDSPPPPVPVNELYHLIQYQVAQDGAYSGSVWSLPVGPTQTGTASPAVSGAWRFQHTVPASNFLTVASPVNPYAIIGQPITLGFRTADIYGNALPDTFPVPFTPLYQDPLIGIGGWPGVQVYYSFAVAGPGSADLVLTAAFDPESVVPPMTSPASIDSPNGSGNAWNRQLGQLDARYQQISDQLTDPNTQATLTCSLLPDGSPACDIASDLEAFVGEIRSEIATLWQQGPPSPHTGSPGRLTHTIVTPISFASVSALGVDVQPLTVTVALQRAPALVDPLASQNMPTAVAVSTALLPDLNTLPASPAGSPDTASSPLRRFALSFEAAFTGFDGGTGKLLLAQRSVLHSGPGVAQVPDLWAVRWSPSAGISASFDGSLVSFALQPLSTSPMSGTVAGKAYSGVDLDLWAEQFLAAVDAFLSPQLAVAVAILDDRYGTSYYQELLGYKQQLAAAIPQGLTNVLVEQAGLGSLSAAQDRLQAALLSALSNAYQVSTIVQVLGQVTVAGQAEAGSPNAPPPQLYGGVGPLVQSSSPTTSRQYTFSEGLLTVAPGSQWMTVLVTVADPSAQTSLVLPLAYQVSYMQHDFMTQEAYEGYVPSSWLKFVLPSQSALTLPMTATDSPAGAAEIPIPLPFEPDTPILVRQQAEGVAPSSPMPESSPEQEIADAMVWSYDVLTQHNWADQDELVFEVSYNTPPGSGSSTGGLGSPTALAAGLFTALAPFQAAYPSLAAQFNVIVQEAYPTAPVSPPSGSPSPASAIIQQFTALVGDVAQARTGSTLDMDALVAGPSGSPTLVDQFRLVPGATGGSSLTVSLFGRSTQSGSPSTSPAVWPTLTPQGPGALPAWTPDPTQARLVDGWWEIDHAWPPVAPGDDAIDALDVLELTWTGLHVLDRQTADLAAYVVRNAVLIPGETTNEAFIYQTQTVRFANPAIPLIEVGPLPALAPAVSLTESLDQILLPMMGAGQTLDAFLRVQVSYAYQLAVGPAGDAIMASTAILLADNMSLSGAGMSPGTVAAPIAAELGAWHAANPLPSAGATLDFAIILFATVEGQQLPLVTFEQIPVLVDAVPPGWWQ